MKAAAIIPARGGSKRIPRKNIAPLGGLPLLAHPVKACLAAGIFDHVIVSTEDAEIAAVAEKYGARAVARPPELSSDTAEETDAYVHALGVLAAEGVNPGFFCAVYPTAAFVTSGDLRNSYEKMKSGAADVLMGVSSYPIHPFKALEENESGFLRMVYPERCLERSQTYPHYVASNGTFYWFRTENFLEKPDYYPEKLAGYELPRDRAVDIDTPEDLAWARLLAEGK